MDALVDYASSSEENDYLSPRNEISKRRSDFPYSATHIMLPVDLPANADAVADVKPRGSDRSNSSRSESSYIDDCDEIEPADVNSNSDSNNCVVREAMACQVSGCVAGQGKYTCPGCAIRFCSVSCGKSHKLQTLCTGKRNPAAAVEIGSLTSGQLEAVLLSDFRFLEDVARQTDGARRRLAAFGTLIAPPLRGAGASAPPTMARVPHDVHLLLRHARARGVWLRVMPRGMARHDRNTSYWKPKSSARRRKKKYATGVNASSGATAASAAAPAKVQRGRSERAPDSDVGASETESHRDEDLAKISLERKRPRDKNFLADDGRLCSNVDIARPNSPLRVTQAEPIVQNSRTAVGVDAVINTCALLGDVETYDSSAAITVEAAGFSASLEAVQDADAMKVVNVTRQEAISGSDSISATTLDAPGGSEKIVAVPALTLPAVTAETSVSTAPVAVSPTAVEGRLFWRVEIRFPHAVKETAAQLSAVGKRGTAETKWSDYTLVFDAVEDTTHLSDLLLPYVGPASASDGVGTSLDPLGKVRQALVRYIEATTAVATSSDTAISTAAEPEVLRTTMSGTGAPSVEAVGLQVLEEQEMTRTLSPGTAMSLTVRPNCSTAAIDNQRALGRLNPVLVLLEHPFDVSGKRVYHRLPSTTAGSSGNGAPALLPSGITLREALRGRVVLEFPTFVAVLPESEADFPPLGSVPHIMRTLAPSSVSDPGEKANIAAGTGVTSHSSALDIDSSCDPVSTHDVGWPARSAGFGEGNGLSSISSPPREVQHWRSPRGSGRARMQPPHARNGQEALRGHGRTAPVFAGGVRSGRWGTSTALSPVVPELPGQQVTPWPLTGTWGGPAGPRRGGHWASVPSTNVGNYRGRRGSSYRRF